MTTTFVLGTLTSISANFINPYTGELLAVNGDYFINDTYVYGGSDPDDTLLSSTHNQFFSLEDEFGALLLEGFESFLMAGGDDILNLASTTNILGNINISMGSGNDIAWSNNGDDTIDGGAGNDILNGGGGNDTIFGGHDNDIIRGGEGNDTIHGEDGFDTVIYDNVYANYTLIDQGFVIYVSDLVGNDGADTLGTVERIQFTDGYYENGTFHPLAVDDVFVATDAVEFFDGGDGNDTVDYSNSLSRVKVDLLNGTGDDGYAEGDTYLSIENVIGSDLTSGTDYLYGDAGSNQLWGLRGNDKLEGGAGADILDGGEGEDFAQYTRSATGVDVDLTRATQIGGDAQGDTLTNIEHIYGSSHGDILTGDSSNNRIYGARGNDTISGGLGNDRMDGGRGDDTYHYTGGKDIIADRENGNDTVIFDSIWSPTNVIVSGNVINFAGNNTDRITFNDITLIESFVFNGYGPMDLATLQSFAAPVTVTGTSSDDTLLGTVLAQTFEGLGGTDTVDYSGSDTRVIVDLSSNSGSEGFAAGDTYVSIENIIGSDLVNGDKLFGDSGANHIWGLNGNDILEGGAGADILDGGIGSDFASYTRSNSAVIVDLLSATQSGGHAEGDVLINIEKIRGSDFNDSLGGNAENNNLYGGDGNDNINARGGDDFLSGGDGNDSLLGGDGNDTLFGDDGDDTLYGLNGNDYLNGGRGIDFLHGGADADTFAFGGLEVLGQHDFVTDFSLVEGDMIDVSDILVNYDSVTDAITDFVEMTTIGSDTFISVDANGGGDDFVLVGILQNVTGLTDEEALETSGTLITM